jgi:hypothetical protein
VPIKWRPPTRPWWLVASVLFAALAALAVTDRDRLWLVAAFMAYEVVWTASMAWAARWTRARRTWWPEKRQDPQPPAG